MKRLIWLFPALWGLCMLGQTSQMTHEEAVVRTAYAKLSYAVDLNTAYQLATSNPKLDSATLRSEILVQGLHFTLSDFVTGKLSDIAQQKYVPTLGQYPDGQDMISVALSSVTHEDVGGRTAKTDTATAHWTKGPNGNPPDLTVGEMMPTLQQESGLLLLDRYCTFTVTASLAGRSRTYRAAFLFAAGGEVATGDVVVGLGGGALSRFISQPVHPDIFLQTSLGKQPAIHDFLQAGQRQDQSCGSSDACCDLQTLQCGVSSAELRRLP